MSHNHALNLLRIVAALGVALFHYLYYGPQKGWITIKPDESIMNLAQYGSLGVYLFFMISGYVIIRAAWYDTPSEYAFKRWFRLWPTFAVCVIMTHVLMESEGVHPDFKSNIVDVLSNLSMLSNFIPKEYHVRDVDGVYWSLYVEIQFYFYMWILLHISQWRQNVTKVMLIWIVLIGWCGAAMWLGVHVPWSVQHLLMVKYGPWFILGAAAGYTANTVDQQRIKQCYRVIGIAVIAITVSSLDALDWMMGSLACVGLFLLLAFNTNVWMVESRFNGLIYDLSTQVAPITYAFYLLHHNIGITLIEWSNQQAGVYTGVLVVLMIVSAMSWATHRAVTCVANRIVTSS